MAVKKVLRLGNPELRKVSQPIEESEVGTKEFKRIIRDMFETMRFESGIGLAAPQIGILKRLVVIGSEEENPRYPKADRLTDHILINPVITHLEPSKEGDGFWEGCLSVPGMRGYVERPEKIQIEYYDEKWNHIKKIVEGFPAIVYQHECDHLDGVLYVDRLKDPRLFGFTEEMNTEGKELD
ncbi:MAG: peptide deformylase [Leptospiraceae bacterium]|nr:peptide deformylase [Leptospiraceae bacterium]